MTPLLCVIGLSMVKLVVNVAGAQQLLSVVSVATGAGVATVGAGAASLATNFTSAHW